MAALMLNFGQRVLKRQENLKTIKGKKIKHEKYDTTRRLKEKLRRKDIFKVIKKLVYNGQAPGQKQIQNQAVPQSGIGERY